LGYSSASNDPLGDTGRVLHNVMQSDVQRKTEASIHQFNNRNKKNAPSLFTFTAVATKGLYAGKGRIMGIGFGYTASDNEKHLTGYRDNKSVKKSAQPYRNGMSASMPGFGRELIVESYKSMVNGKLPQKYTTAEGQTIPFQTEVEKKDQNGKEIYSGKQIEIFSIKLGFNLGIDISLKINIPNTQMESAPSPLPIGQSAADKTYIKQNPLVNIY